MTCIPTFDKGYDFAPMIEAFKQSRNTIIVGHIDPDGDTLGSALALWHALKAFKSKGDRVRVVFADPIPLNLQFIPGFEQIITPSQIGDQPDLVILVDCATLNRTGNGWLDPYLVEAKLAIIDHHALRDDIESISIIDSDSAATGQMIYHLVSALGLDLTMDMASCIYLAISSDTGGFRFANTTAETFSIGSHLVNVGVDLEQMRIQLFESRPFRSMTMLGLVVNHLEQSPDQKLVWTYISDLDKIANDADSNDCSNLSFYTMYPIGAKVGIYFEELEKDKKVKLSMRCRQGYSVGDLARQFGGGGHVLAAGCKIDGKLDEVMAMVLASARDMIERSEMSEQK